MRFDVSHTAAAAAAAVHSTVATVAASVATAKPGRAPLKLLDCSTIFYALVADNDGGGGDNNVKTPGGMGEGPFVLLGPHCSGFAACCHCNESIHLRTGAVGGGGSQPKPAS